VYKINNNSSTAAAAATAATFITYFSLFLSLTTFSVRCLRLSDKHKHTHIE